MRIWPARRIFQLFFGLFLILMAWAHAVQWQHHGRDLWVGLRCLFFTYAGLETIWQYFAVYWEITPSGLYCHRLLRHEIIPFNDILRIELKNHWWSYSFVSVEYDRHRASPKPGRLWINPKDREAFVSELSERAASAVFIAPPAKTVSQLLWWRRLGAVWGSRFATLFMQRGRS
jgi:hypothetical protein